jgi:hypothetical protein
MNNSKPGMHQTVQARRHESALVAGQLKLALATPSHGTQSGFKST